MAQVSIDGLNTQKHTIDLTAMSAGDFGLEEGLVLTNILDDILLVEYIDESSGEGGDAITKGGIYIPTNTLQQAWRKAKVILAGPNASLVKVGDIVIFPNNLGVAVANLEVAGKDTLLKKGIFLNEDRIFGICKLKDED